jgi:uncharacterized protein YnzC (UPF0291/DUF896 family)
MSLPANNHMPRFRKGSRACVFADNLIVFFYQSDTYEVTVVITPELIERINELAAKQRQGILTGAEKDEQAKLRQVYVDSIKGQLKAHLDAVRHSHAQDCDCGCHHNH